jgi:hypothetical protein
VLNYVIWIQNEVMNEQSSKLRQNNNSSGVFMLLFSLDFIFTNNFKKNTGNEPTVNVTLTLYTEQPITFLVTSPADSQSITRSRIFWDILNSEKYVWSCLIIKSRSSHIFSISSHLKKDTYYFKYKDQSRRDKRNLYRLSCLPELECIDIL